ncbi:MAG: THUMP domain-containing protein [Owenweeksia sp.]
MKLNNDSMPMLAKTYFGLEDVLAKELQVLGAQNVKTITRGVTFEGDLGFLYKANLWTRTALRIMVPIARFKIRNEEELYKKIKGIEWEAYFDVQKTFVIDANVFARQYKNSLFIAQRSKDGLVDRFREKTGQRPSVHTREPDIRINVHISNENVTVSLDSSGDSLHKRGYRSEADRAPISEVLAAGILKLTGWDGLQDFIDPMCGSGTFLIEAALIAHNIPPNIFRKNFAFKNWKNFDQELFGLLFDKALEKEKNFHFAIYGYDKVPFVLRKAEKNLRNALMHDQVKIEQADFLTFQKPEAFRGSGLVVFNPPYGEKMEADIPELYKGIGDTFKREFAGFNVWLFTSSSEGLKNVGLKPARKIQLYNGKLESWLVNYEIYQGSRKHA